jgi:hypothetical protein
LARRRLLQPEILSALALPASGRVFPNRTTYNRVDGHLGREDGEAEQLQKE